MSQDERDTAWAKFTPPQQLMFQASWRELGYENEGLAKPKRRLRLALLCFIVALAIGGVLGFLVLPGQKQQDAERAAEVAAKARHLEALRHWLDKEAQRRISTGTAISPDKPREMAPVLITRPAMPVVDQPSAGPSVAEMDAARLRCVQHLTTISSPALAISYTGFGELTFRSPNAGGLIRPMLERGDFSTLAGQCYFKSVSFTDNAGYFEHWDLPLSAEDIEKIKFSR
jgi:hypothetical protein